LKGREQSLLAEASVTVRVSGDSCENFSSGSDRYLQTFVLCAIPVFDSRYLFLPMPIAPKAPNEPERLAVLRSLNILDSEPEADFDRIVHLASLLCKVPIALVSIVDEHRQWFKARVGLALSETGLDNSFCAYAMLNPSELLVIPDALEDPRVQDMGVVTGPPKIRFYAGAPLVTNEGMPIGSLCVIDDKPRQLAPEEAEALRTLSRHVVTMLELRRTTKQQTEILEELTAIQRELAKRNQELEEAKDAALRLARSKSEFLANMSHEIRTPMNGVLGMVEMLLQTPLNSQQQEYTWIIHQSANALLTVLNDILDFSKIEAGKLTLSDADFRISELVHSVLSIFRGAAEEKGLELRLVQPPDGARVVRGPVDRIRQILLNLLSNALKFTAQGKIEVIWDWEDLGVLDCRGLRITVLDTGVGIPEERQEAIFESFTQANGSTNRHYGGSGLGLTISRRLAEMMGGKITLRSWVGRGSEFSLYLPIKIVEQEQELPWQTNAAARSLSPPSWDTTPEDSGPLVLVAEDNLINQKVARLVLKKFGCRVEVVGDGASAVEQVRQRPYDLVLMDVHMPGMDGYEATRQMRAAGVKTPIVAMTASAMDGERVRCLNAGMDDYLTKPIESEKLRKVVEGLGKK
jgi:signal transduction histidine kinase